MSDVAQRLPRFVARRARRRGARAIVDLLQAAKVPDELAAEAELAKRQWRRPWKAEG